MTSIGDCAFETCYSLTSVEIPASVTRIRMYSFKDCSSLANVTIPASVTNIDSLAFDGCSAITSVTIPQYVLDRGLSEVFPDSYASITNVTILEGATNIPANAFAGCAGLRSVSIPESVTNCAENTFAECTFLVDSIEIPEGVTSIGAYEYARQAWLKSITIPASVTSIGAHAFDGCSGLTNVTFCGDLQSIGDGAFAECSGLGHIAIPASVTQIGAYAFTGCTGLESVTIPASVAGIEEGTFFGCTSLANVTIPNSVTYIGDGAFSGCGGIRQVTLPPCAFDMGMENVFPDAYSSLESVGIGGGVTYIWEGSFGNCGSLASVTIPDGVTHICDFAFAGCGELVEVTIPDSVGYIGSGAFQGCGGLVEMSIPSGVWGIGEGAFADCGALQSITVAQGNENYRSESGLLIEKNTGTLVAVPGGMANVTIPEGVEGIGNYAFTGCRAVESVTIPASVTHVEPWAFAGCGSLQSISVAQGNAGFVSAGGLLLDGDGTFLLAVPSGMTDVTMPESVTEIGEGALAGCSNITSVTVSQLVLDLGMRNVFPDAFASISNVTIPDGVSSIAREAFSGCSALTGIAIPASVTRIDTLAFEDCASLETVAIHDGVASFGICVFRGCTSLANVICPTSDWDGDGLAELEEFRRGTNPLVRDTDGDGLSDSLEVFLGTDPLHPDTDRDGMSDGWEYRYRLEGPYRYFNCKTHDAVSFEIDSDGDGLPDREEAKLCTNPFVADTDGDGTSDYDEFLQNSDPLDASDMGMPDSRVPVHVNFGDPSYSQSEKYAVFISPVFGTDYTGPAPSCFIFCNENFGECRTETALLKPGWTYQVVLHHLGTDRNYKYKGKSDFDYMLEFLSESDDPETPCPWLTEDAAGLLEGWCDGPLHDADRKSRPVLRATIDNTDFDKRDDKFTGFGKTAYIHVLAKPEISMPSVIGVNDDDDDDEKGPDCYESGLFYDDDLVAIKVSVSCPRGIHGVVEVRNGSFRARLWKDLDKKQEVPFGNTDSFEVSPAKTSRTYYIEGEGRSPSYLDEEIRAVFRCGGVEASNSHKFTFVERIAEPITTERVNGQIVNPCCAILGAATPMKVSVLPNNFPDDKIKWKVVSGSGSFADGKGREATFVASGPDGSDTVVQVDVGDCPGNAPQFRLHAKTMRDVLVYPCVISRQGRPPPVTLSRITSMIEEVNVIYRQVGMHFSLGAQPTNVVDEILSRDGLVDTNVFEQILGIMPSTNRLEVYFIEGSEEDDAVGLCRRLSGLVIRKSAGANTLGHEIGHFFGLDDIYIFTQNTSGAICPDLLKDVNRFWAFNDWNNGTGSRFYAPELKQYEMIKRLLMYGIESASKCDIPEGAVYGKPVKGGLDDVFVGRSGFTVKLKELR